LILDDDNERLLNMLITFIFQTDNYKMLKILILLKISFGRVLGFKSVSASIPLVGNRF